MLNPAKIVALQTVQRWHTRGGLGGQTLADHSCAVALLAAWIAGETLDQEHIAQVITVGLLHDLHETVYGDLPYPAKAELRAQGLDLDQHFRERYWGPGSDPYDNAEPFVQKLVDVADIVEAALYARRNGPAELAEAVRLQAVKAIRETLQGSPATRALRALGEVEG